MRSLRTVYRTCSNRARRSFSGGIDRRPTFAYMVSNCGPILRSATSTIARIARNGWSVATRRSAEGKPEVFNFLGFTHICGKTRKTGRFIVRRKTIPKRLSAKLSELKAELRRRWHQPVAEVGKWLRSVVQGYFNYHAVPGNMDSLNSFRAQV